MAFDIYPTLLSCSYCARNRLPFIYQKLQMRLFPAKKPPALQSISLVLYGIRRAEIDYTFDSWSFHQAHESHRTQVHHRSLTSPRRSHHTGSSCMDSRMKSCHMTVCSLPISSTRTLRVLGITYTFTSAYNPQTNGLTCLQSFHHRHTTLLCIEQLGKLWWILRATHARVQPQRA